MERTPAAQAMEWSLELEKGLRSKSPAKCIEAISRIGTRLEWWNRHSKISTAEYKMFGLIPGEDKLFLNAILLRLADAFRTGDKRTKYCIVKTFFQELKCRRMRVVGEKEEESIFLKNKLDNYLEILRRVKVVFDDGDVEERALALYLFGCWADFAKDSADIRYVILSSSVSDNILEVKAFLFAAGRFCELAYDFAGVFLEILVNRLKSCETSEVFRLAGARMFPKLGCSCSLAKRAYKTGLELLSSYTSGEPFSLAMLISLTKIASRWSLLIPTQIGLLSTFLVKEGELQMQATTLKCLQCILARGVCPSPAARDLIQSLVNVVSESKKSPALMHKALKVLHLILSYNLPAFHMSQMLEVLSLLLTFTENVFQVSILSERLFAVWVLLDILGKFLGRARLESSEIASAFAHQLISFVMDRISVLMKLKVDRHQPNEEIEQEEVLCLLRLLLNLIEKHSDVCGLVLVKVTTFMKQLVDAIGDVNTKQEGALNCDISTCAKEVNTPISLKLILLLAEMMNTCLESLEVENTIPHEVLNPLKLLVDSVLLSSSFQLHTYSICMILLCFHGAHVCMNQMTEHHVNFSLSCRDIFVQHDSLIVEYAKKIFETRDYWSFYKAGKRAASHGSWSMATFIFEQLMKLILSDSKAVWLKSLALFSRSESWLEHLTHVAAKDSLCKAGEDMATIFNLCDHAEGLAEACNGLHIARRTLGTSVSGLPITFQKWFLVLRAKVLEIMRDTTRLLGAVSFVKDADGIGQMIPLERLNPLVRSLSEISCEFKKVANEYDLLAVSFYGMDTKSRMRVSVLAASCSLLAFSTGMASSIPYSYARGENANCSSDISEEQFRVTIIQDLLERIRPIDYETSKHLLMLLKVYHKKSMSCSLPQSRNLGLAIRHKARAVDRLCRYAVSEIASLQNEAGRLCKDGSVLKISANGFQLLVRIISEWMQIPFKCPNHFFRVGSDATSEIFVVHEDGKILDGSSVLPGSLLSLNVCLQLRNMPPDLPAKLVELHCLVRCTTQAPRGEKKDQSWLNSDDEWGSDEILDLNGKLARYVTGSITPAAMQNRDQTLNHWCVEEYLHFQPNEGGQGFSTCLLDISAFPAGSYRIQWHSCFVDNEGSYWSLIPSNSGPCFILAAT